MDNNSFFQLPQPTSHTVTGPRLEAEGSTLIVKYDFEHDDGSIEWAQVIFHQILAVQHRENVCCTAEDLEAYNQLVKYTDSDWLEKIHKCWREFLGRQAQEGQEFTCAHWRIYFDDAGCTDVIAQSFEIR